MIKRLVITSILSFLIIISFTLMLYSRILSENAILASLDEIGYYDYAKEDIMKKLEMELPNKELKFSYDKYVTKELIKKDIKTILNNYYNKSDNNIKKDFYDNVIINFNESDENIKSLVNNLASTYYNNLFRVDKLDKVIDDLPLKDSYRGFSFVFFTATLLLIALFIENTSVYNSFIASGFIFLIPKALVKLSDVLKDFYYYNNSLSYFIKMYSYNIIDTYFKYGIVLIVIGLIGLIIHLFRKDN